MQASYWKLFTQNHYAMLTRTITCFLLLLTISPLTAQLSVGIQGGFNSSTIYFSGLPSGISRHQQNKNHYFAGITSSYTLCKKWSIGLDAQYAVRGVGYAQQEDANAVTNSRRRNIDLTPKVSYQLLKNVDLQFGIYHSFFLRHEVQLGNTDNWVEPFAIYYAKTDIGLSPGLRFHIGRFSLLASGQIGLKSIAKIDYTNEIGEIIENVHEKNRAIQLGLGYRIF